MTRKMWQLVAVVGALALLITACPRDEEAAQPGATPGQTDGQPAGGQQAGGILQAVQDRDELVCGVNDAVPGFGVVTEEGENEGFDVDYCRVVAAAVLGDAEAVEYVPLTAEARFTALQAGEIDVLIRNTTWTATRDGGEGATFLTTTFYDGQGMMVEADRPYESLEDMDGTTVCVLSGTTTELNLESTFRGLGLDYDPLTFEDNDTLREAFLAGRCDGWTSDKSQLAAVRSAWPEEEGGPEALRILDVTMSKEPLGPVVRDGDTAWAQAVDWAIIATIQAEEFGISSDNLDQMLEETDPTSDPEVARFLGLTDFDAGLGLPGDFAEQVVRQVGNYGEIYERNVAEGIGLERCPAPDACQNELWTEGGLHYAPPYR